MIPKKIHYCWFGSNPMPRLIKKCIKSWKKNLPDYEFVLWNEDKFDINSIPWVKEAYEAKKYAFVADYIRCYALFNEGGIYLDTDVEVLKPFDDLLDLPYFIGKETASPIESAVVGAEKGFQLYKLLIDYYQNRNFNVNGNLDTKPIPYVINEIAQQHYSVINIADPSLITQNSESQDQNNPPLFLLPAEFFSPKSWRTGEIHKTSNTYSIHHFVASWQSKRYRRGLYLKRKFPKLYARLQELKSKGPFHNIC